jgi:transposase InsO family protein
MAESFFATIEKELLAHRTFRTRDEARRAIFDYIEGFYNRRRRHSSTRLPGDSGSGTCVPPAPPIAPS